MSKRGTLGRKGRHWSQKFREVVVAKSSNGSFNVCIEGGAENGEFARIGSFKQDKVKYKHGKLQVNDIILEVSEVAIAGYTLPDVVSLIKKTGDLLEMKVVKPGYGITSNLKEYLAGRFEENSVDSHLQKTIRDNLYERTVPCTTRVPRGNEKHGKDYIFVTIEQFREMEENGELLESGVFEDNYYGTPKPSKDPSKPRFPPPNNQRGDQGSDTSSRGPSRSNSIESAGNMSKINKQSKLSKSYHTALHMGHMDNLGPLPANWEIAYTEDNEMYFIDHNTGTTHWHDPRLADDENDDHNDYDDEELPRGWEKVEDPKFGTYYIDHVNRTTQFENPVLSNKRGDKKINSMNHEPPSMLSSRVKNDDVEPSARWQNAGFGTDDLGPNYYNYHVKEQRITTVLQKGLRGFGFTIVGGDHPDEPLQVKSIVPGGPASVDGKIRIGDTLTKVNGMSLAGHNHRYVVGMFQSMSQGDEVELDLIRGHPLSFDSDDASVHSNGVPKYHHDDMRPPPSIDDGYTNGKFGNGQYKDTLQINKYNKVNSFAPSGNSAFNEPKREWSNQSSNDKYYDQVDNVPLQSSTLPRTSTQRVTSSQAPRVARETLNVHVVKGSNGFGFTIADSHQGQRIKQIMDAGRCQDLQEGDLLIEINGFNVQRYSHNEVVNMLKSCPRDTEAAIIVQRGVPEESSPIPNRRSLEPTKARAPRAQSTPPMRSSQYNTNVTMATEGQPTKNYETGSLQRPSRQARVSSSGDSTSYQSLKRAVASQLRANGADNISIGGGSMGTGDDYLEMTLLLKRGESGFGFRVVGGDEEGSQISVGKIVPKSSAHKDGRLRRGDEILSINDTSVVGSTHRQAISLLSSAAANNKVKLTIRRWKTAVRSGRSTPVGSLRRSVSQASQLSEISQNSMRFSRSAGNLAGGYISDGLSSARSAPAVNKPRYYDVSHHNSEGQLSQRVDDNIDMTKQKDVLVERREEEGFGFVILSTENSIGSTIGRIIDGSPAYRCGQLRVGDRIVAVNGLKIIGMNHSDIVSMIKTSGTSLTLKIISQTDKEPDNPRDRPTRKSTGDVYGYDEPDSGRNYRSGSMGVLQDKGSQNKFGEFKPFAQNGYDYGSGDRKNRGEKPPIMPKPKRPNSEMNVNQIKSVAQQQPNYKPVPAPRRSFSTNGTMDRGSSRGEDETISVQLKRGQQGYGFSLRGGLDLGMPLYVLRMADGGTAHRDGRLMVGDELVEINGQPTFNMNHSDAIDAIKHGGNTLEVVVRRSGKQSYMSNTLPNGGSNNTGVRRQQRFYY